MMIPDKIKKCCCRDIETKEVGEWHKLPDGEEINKCEECKRKHHHYRGCGCKKHISKRDMEKAAKAKDAFVDKLTTETNDVLHETLRRYFVTVSQYGYYNYEAVYRILALDMIAKFRKEFACFWNKKDEGVISRLLNCLYCSICAIPRPSNSNVETQLNTTGNTKQDYLNYYEDDFEGSYSDL